MISQVRPIENLDCKQDLCNGCGWDWVKGCDVIWVSHGSCEGPLVCLFEHSSSNCQDSHLSTVVTSTCNSSYGTLIGRLAKPWETWNTGDSEQIGFKERQRQQMPPQHLSLSIKSLFWHSATLLFERMTGHLLKHDSLPLALPAIHRGS